MKNFTFLAFITFLLVTSFKVTAQIKPELAQAQQITRCGTWEAIERRLQEDPAFRNQWEQKQRDAANAQRGNQTSRVSTLTGPVTIPVIVHVVLPNPSIITEAQIDYLLNQLNACYSGLNADSTNGTLFYNVRGHSLIRFTRARRDPNGNLTNGVERKVGTVQITSNTYQPIKHTSQGGLDPWDITQYYNLWVGDAGTSGLLGIAPGIGVGGQTETTTSATGIDGICVDYRGFSNGCFSYGAFAQAKTVVHEIGHNFGLFHTFSGCTTGADFAQLTPAGQTLPASLLASADDTPNQSTSTSGCPSGTVASNCSGVANPPGKMYQNYLDYTDDACYSMFTKGQVARMEYVLENYRPGYLTTLGAVPPASAPTVDIAPTAVVNPGGSEFNPSTCSSITYATITCPGTFAPKVTITNNGVNAITSFTAGLLVNGVAQTPQTFNGSLASGNTVNITFGNVTVSNGTYVLKFFTSNANGAGADQVPGNDTLTYIFTVGGSSNGPIVEPFTSTTFPPAGWRVINPDNGITWTRSATAGFSAAGSATINLYNYNRTGEKDYLASPAINTTGVDSIKVTFQLAHAPYSATSTTFGPDTLQLVYSPDCGTTWLPFGGYKKWSNATGNNNLATAPVTTASFIPTSAAQWRLESVSQALPLPGNPASILIGWLCINHYGNNIYLDDINITRIGVPRFDAGVTAIAKPQSRVCNTSETPTVTIKNFGTDTLRSVIINYGIDNGAISTYAWTGSLPKNASATVTLNSISTGAAGTHTFVAYTSNPNNNADQQNSNDTLRTTYTVYTVQPLTKVAESFSNTTFPPAGWSIVNPNNDMTWTRNATYGKNAPGSAWFNDWNNATNGRYDDLVLPVFSYSGIDSIFLNFQLAAATYSYPGATGVPIDTLAVLLSKDCGNTFTTVYKKWGNELQTVSDPNFPKDVQFFPRANQWRRDSINLGSYLSGSESQMVVAFRFSGNFENNIFIDDVNLYTQVLPTILKQQGYFIQPSPFHNQFAVWHYVVPSTLKYVNVYNAAGQLVWRKEYNKNAEKYIVVDLTGKASGVYVVSLGYEDKFRNVSQRVVKY